MSDSRLRIAKRMERAKLTDEYADMGLFSPVEGNGKLKKLVDSTSDVVNLSIMTEQTPPQNVREVASEAALAGGYIKNHISVRQAIADYYSEALGAHFDPKSEIVVTVGGQLALDAIFRILVDQGDRVIVADPEYATFEPMIAMNGGIVESIPLKLSENGWEFDLDTFEGMISPETRMVVLSNCQNPTGYVYRKETLEAIADLVIENDCWLVSDEIWSFLVLGEDLEFSSFASIDRLKHHLLTVFSLSKTFGMSGYRIGALLGPEAIVSEANNIVRFAVQAAPTISQYAAVEALNLERTGSWLGSRVVRLREQTRRAAARLDSLDGVVCAPPESGCFLFPDISGLGMDSLEFCMRAVSEGGVYVLPGYFYGKHSDKYVRISCSVPDEDFDRGIERLVNFITDCQA